MPRLRMKEWKEITHLPVWATKGGVLVLQWWPKYSVVTMLPQCPRCCLWHSPTATTVGGCCLACETNKEAVDAATFCVLEALTKLVPDESQ